MADVTSSKNELRLFTKALMAITAMEAPIDNKVINVCKYGGIYLGDIVRNPSTKDLRCNLTITKNTNSGAHIDLIHKNGSAYIVAFAPRNSKNSVTEMAVTFDENGELTDSFKKWFISSMVGTQLTMFQFLTRLSIQSKNIFNPDNVINSMNIPRNFFNTYATYPTVLVGDMHSILPCKTYIKDNNQKHPTICLEGDKIDGSDERYSWLFEPLTPTTNESLTIVIVFNDANNRTVKRPIFRIDISDGVANIIPYAGSHVSDNYSMTLDFMNKNGTAKTPPELTKDLADLLGTFATRSASKIKDSTTDKTYDSDPILVADDETQARYQGSTSVASKLSYGNTYPANGSVAVRLVKQVSDLGDAHFDIFYDSVPIAKLYVNSHRDEEIDDAVRLLSDDCNLVWIDTTAYKPSNQYGGAGKFESLEYAYTFISRLIDLRAAIKDAQNAVAAISVDNTDTIQLDRSVVRTIAKITSSVGYSGHYAAPEAAITIESSFNSVPPFTFTIRFDSGEMVLNANLKLPDQTRATQVSFRFDYDHSFDDFINSDSDIANAFMMKVEEYTVIMSSTSNKLLDGKEKMGQMADQNRALKLFHIRPNESLDPENVDEMYLAIDKAKRAYVAAFDPDNNKIITFGQMHEGETAAVRRFYDDDVNTFAYSTSVCQGRGGSIIAMYTDDGIKLFASFDGHKDREITFVNDEPPILDSDFAEWFVANCEIPALKQKPRGYAMTDIDPDNPFSSMFGITGMEYINDDSED